MFLSLVRPDRISSPITSRAAVTTSWGVDEFAVVMGARMLPAPAAGHPYPAIAGYDASSHSPATSGPAQQNPDRMGPALDRIDNRDQVEGRHAGLPDAPISAAARHRLRGSPNRPRTRRRR